MLKRILAGVVLSLMLTGGAAAGPLELDEGDYVAAARHWAEQGDAEAQVALGSRYHDGKGVPQDYTEAAKWYRLAAEQGHAKAQFLLGASYATGKGVPQDYTEAAKWYRLAAEQGNADAQSNLGERYAEGRGVQQDYVQAHKWFNLTVSRFSASGADKREQAVKNRDIIASIMTPAQIAEAQKLAREWRPKKGKPK
jgi:hypothetical protein